MADEGESDDNRDHRRRHWRRHHLKRRHRRRRLVAGAVGVAAVVVLAVVLIPGGSGTDGAGTVLAKAPRVSALERSLRGHAEQQAALEQTLGYTRFIHEGTRAKREVALTFDDGPGPYTKTILDVLRKHDAPATFFLLGNMVGTYPDVVRRELRQGHAIGGHTFDHPHLGQLPLSSQIPEFNDFEQAMDDNRLPLPRLFRPPYGSFNADTIDLLDNRRMLMVLWSTDTGDYLDPGSDVIAERALDGVRPGSVILMHDGGGDRAETIGALPIILRGLKKRHLKPVTVPELLVSDPPPRGQSLEQLSGIATETDAPPAEPTISPPPGTTTTATPAG